MVNSSLILGFNYVKEKETNPPRGPLGEEKMDKDQLLDLAKRALSVAIVTLETRKLCFAAFPADGQITFLKDAYRQISGKDWTYLC